MSCHVLYAGDIYSAVRLGIQLSFRAGVPGIPMGVPYFASSAKVLPFDPVSFLPPARQRQDPVSRVPGARVRLPRRRALCAPDCACARVSQTQDARLPFIPRGFFAPARNRRRSGPADASSFLISHPTTVFPGSSPIHELIPASQKNVIFGDGPTRLRLSQRQSPPSCTVLPHPRGDPHGKEPRRPINSASGRRTGLGDVRRHRLRTSGSPPPAPLPCRARQSPAARRACRSPFVRRGRRAPAGR